METTVQNPIRSPRVISIDALRGLVMFIMIFVNDLGEVLGDIVPPSMKHFLGKDGMTFVDMVFPAFLFIVGMSLPFALGSRLAKGEPMWKTISHILFRTFSLLFIGILMVNGRPDPVLMGWSGKLWCALLYLAAIFAFCAISPTQGKAAPESRKKIYDVVSLILRLIGFATLIFLTFAFRNAKDKKIISFDPFYIRHIWYGILGHIGWAYLIGAIIYLVFRTHRTALLGSMALLICLFAADRVEMFKNTWLSHQIAIGTGLGSLAAITVGGLLFVTILITPETSSLRARVRFTLLYMAGFAAAAWLLDGLYGVSKTDATPTWCFLACTITAGFWLILYFVCDVHPVRAISRPLSLAGQNVFLAYLLAELFAKIIVLFQWDEGYNHLAGAMLSTAIARSIGCALFIMLITVGLNRVGFRSKL